jgi:ribosomal protein S4
MKDPNIGSNDLETFFQQKWRAKGILRTYHGEHIVERKWERMFSRRLLSVVDMDTKYMATKDGSELAAGRGSGPEREPNWNQTRVARRSQTPYMQMTFAPMERRLDIAVFRAMFASSARQARQFCVHGAVKVNGKVVSVIASIYAVWSCRHVSYIVHSLV